MALLYGMWKICVDNTLSSFALNLIQTLWEIFYEKKEFANRKPRAAKKKKVVNHQLIGIPKKLKEMMSSGLVMM